MCIRDSDERFPRSLASLAEKISGFLRFGRVDSSCVAAYETMSPSSSRSDQTGMAGDAIVVMRTAMYYHVLGGSTMTTTVNTKGQVTIPEPLRSKYGFPPGTKVVWIERDGELIPRPVKPLRELFGSLRAMPGQPTLTAALLRERRAERDREDR